LCSYRAPFDTSSLRQEMLCEQYSVPVNRRLR
jgi:hypothetical protein